MISNRDSVRNNASFLEATAPTDLLLTDFVDSCQPHHSTSDLMKRMCAAVWFDVDIRGMCRRKPAALHGALHDDAAN